MEATPIRPRQLGFGAPNSSVAKKNENNHDHDWENVKENAKPLKRGRNVQKLNSFARGALSTRKAEKTREETKMNFEQEIKNAANNLEHDSLDTWIRYIKWTEEEYPAGGQQSNLLVLLERCCRTFLKVQEMKNDDRYIKIWLKYFDLLEQPLPLFQFLCANRIGERVSLFYIAWALVAEHAKNYSLADKVFTRGKNFGAKPKKALATRQKQFQRRMARHWMRQSSHDEEPLPNSLTQASQDLLQDENLARNTSSKRGLANGVSNTRYGSSQRSFSSGTISNQPRRQGVSTMGNFNIFVEGSDENTNSVSGQYGNDLVTGSPGSMNNRGTNDPTTIPWDHFTGREDRKKENSGIVTRWNEGGLKLVGEAGRKATRRGRNRPLPSGFNICCDDDVKEANKNKKSEWQKAPSSVSIRRRLEGPGRTAEEKEARELINDPLKHLRAVGGAAEVDDTRKKLGPREPIMAPPLPPPTSTITAPILPSSHASESQIIGIKKVQKSFSSTGNLGYHDSLLKDGCGKIVSFEEQRARKYSFASLQEAASEKQQKQKTQQKQSQPTRTFRRGIGSADAKRKKTKKLTKSRRCTMDVGAIQDIYKQFQQKQDDDDDDYYSSSGDDGDNNNDCQDSGICTIQEGEEEDGAEARKALTFSNCSTSSNHTATKNSNRNFHIASTPASSVIDGANATRKLMFNTSNISTHSQALVGETENEEDVEVADFSDSSNDESVVEPVIGEKNKDKGRKNIIGLNKDDMTCNLQAAMDEIGDLFCSPEFKKLPQLSPGTASERSINPGFKKLPQLSPGTASERSGGGTFSIFQEDENNVQNNRNENEGKEENNENIGPPSSIPHSRRALNLVKPSLILREMKPGEYPSTLPTEVDEEVSFGHISPTEVTSTASTGNASTAVTTTVYEDTIALPTTINLTADDENVHRLLREVDNNDGNNEETLNIETAFLAAAASFKEISKKDKKKRDTLDMLSRMDSLNLTNESVDNNDCRRNTIDLLEECSDSDKEEEQQKENNNTKYNRHRQRQKNCFVNAPAAEAAPKDQFSIFEDVFQEHQDIQKDRRATLLGVRLDGISEADESSGSSSRSNGSGNKSMIEEEEEEDEGHCRRLSMDSLQGCGDLSSIRCEDEDETMQRRWSNASSQVSTPCVVNLPSSKKTSGFSIFTD